MNSISGDIGGGEAEVMMDGEAEGVVNGKMDSQVVANPSNTTNRDKLKNQINPH